MPTSLTPHQAATAVAQNPVLPAGNDERIVGFGVMGLPFASGHYLALRDFPATSFAPAYQSVWHRDPAGAWTFYATTPSEQSCARYFSSATAHPAVQCPIEVEWLGGWTVRIGIPGMLDWRVTMRDSPAARLLTAVGSRLPERAWTTPSISAAMGRVAGPMLNAGQLRLSGTLPNGQQYMIAPTRVWMVADSHAVLNGQDLGAMRPLAQPERLGDFRPPKRGICVVGHGHFETFDPSRHRSADCIRAQG